MSKSAQLKKIDIQALQPGMVIVRVTQQNGPIKIKKSGLVTSQDMVQGLVEMGIQQVEIDPDQTVEIDSAEQPLIKKSATQRMLESNTVTDTRIDGNLSSQFHRSLFLPTVQDMPSAFQYYAKRYLVVGVIALGGFGLGWTMANYQSVLSLFPTKQKNAVVISNNVSDTSTQLHSDASTNTTISQVDTQPAPLQVSEAEQTVEVASSTDNSPVTEVMPNVPEVETKPSETFASQEQAAPAASTNTPKISADLLNKFNKAIAQVSEQDEPVAPQTQTSNDDVPRIDQIPAWVMTELPSMSFSAHMYASDSAERWVRVNGTRMVEGDVIDTKVKIISIEPQHVILNYAGHEFSMAALTDW
jgi:general secretion pathway protein B